MGGGGGGWGVLGCPVAKPPSPHTSTLNGCRTSTILTTIYSCVYTYTYTYQKSYTVHIYTYRRLHGEETVYFPELPIFCAVNTNWRCHITLLISPSCTPAMYGYQSGICIDSLTQQVILGPRIVDFLQTTKFIVPALPHCHIAWVQLNLSERKLRAPTVQQMLPPPTPISPTPSIARHKKIHNSVYLYICTCVSSRRLILNF